jgi:type I restriction enzyme S subunit
MEEWKYIKISELCKKVCSGGTPKSTISAYYGGNIPWLNTKEIDFNRIYKTEKNITQEGLNNSSAKWIEENSVVVAMYGATAGKCAISKIPLTTNQACCNLMINRGLADYRYVYYALCNDYVKLSLLANGGAQQNLNAQQIKDFEIPYRELKEQKAIANVLSSLDDKIAINKRINDNLEWYAILYSINLFEIQIIMISSVLVAERLKSIRKIDLVA